MEHAFNKSVWHIILFIMSITWKEYARFCCNFFYCLLWKLTFLYHACSNIVKRSLTLFSGSQLRLRGIAITSWTLAIACCTALTVKLCCVIFPTHLSAFNVAAATHRIGDESYLGWFMSYHQSPDNSIKMDQCMYVHFKNVSLLKM